MNKEEKTELVKYRIQRAQQTLDEVELMLQNNSWNTAINRLYYAAFYAVSALLVNNDIKAYKHSGIKQMFGQHFVQNGIFSTQQGKLYTELFDKRQKGDYEDFFDFTENDVSALIEPTRDLIEDIKKILRI